MVLEHRLSRPLGFALGSALVAMLAGEAFAQDRTIGGEVLRITSGRTSFMVDLTGDLALENGAEVSLTVDGKQRTGTVKKVTENGNALIRLNKGLPKSVNVGDDVTMTVDKGAVVSGDEKEGSVKLTKGGFKKAYWDEVSFIAAHRRSGVRADVEVSYLGAQGADKAKGGSANEDTELGVDDKTMTFGGAAGFVGRDGIGGGLLLDYVKTDRTASADVTTASIGATGKDENVRTVAVVDLTPYFAYLSRAKTGDFGYGVGVGVPIRTTTAERKVTINSVEAESDPAKTSEMGPSFEFLAGNNSWAALLGITPLSGKITQSGAKDVDHKSTEIALNFEKYGKTLSARAGITFLSTEDKYDGATLKDSGQRFSARLDIGMGSFNVVPFLDYTSTKRKIESLDGTFTEMDLGARFAMSGVYAPFVSLGLNSKSGNEKTADGTKVESETSGIRLAGGVNI